MSTNVTLSDDTYARLEEQARAMGITVAERIAQLAQDAEDRRIMAVIERLQSEGALLPPSQPAEGASSDFAPIAVQGTPLSEIIIAERR